MNWDSPEARLALLESVGIEEYNRQHEKFLKDNPIRPVNTRFGVLFAVAGTKMAFSTRAQAEEFQAKQPVAEAAAQ